MSLSYNQYQSIIREYDSRRSNALRTRDEHLEKIRSEIPEYSELEDRAAEIALAYGKRLILEPETSLSEMDRELADISRTRLELLAKHGYSADYINPQYTCPDCQDTGYINNVKCHCFKQAEIKLLYGQSNIHDYFKKKNFSHLRYDFLEGEDLDHFRRAVSVCRDFADDFDAGARNLILYGTIGTGKSFLSGCVAYELLQSGHSVIYYSSPDLFNKLSDSTFNKASTQTDDNLENIYDCDLLVIDDLGTEIAGQFVNSSLFTCLNERQLRGRSTIISTNLMLDELHQRYSDRVFSRILGNFEMLKLTGPDLRRKYKDINK